MSSEPVADCREGLDLKPGQSLLLETTTICSSQSSPHFSEHPLSYIERKMIIKLAGKTTGSFSNLRLHNIDEPVCFLFYLPQTPQKTRANGICNIGDVVESSVYHVSDGMPLVLGDIHTHQLLNSSLTPVFFFASPGGFWSISPQPLSLPLYLPDRSWLVQRIGIIFIQSSSLALVGSPLYDLSPLNREIRKYSCLICSQYQQSILTSYMKSEFVQFKLNCQIQSFSSVFCVSECSLHCLICRSQESGNHTGFSLLPLVSHHFIKFFIVFLLKRNILYSSHYYVFYLIGREVGW